MFRHQLPPVGLCCGFFEQFLALLLCLLDCSYQMERIFRKMVQLSVQDHIKAFDGILNLNILTALSCKLLRYKERLAQESLYTSCAGYDKLIFIRQFIHSKNGYNVLQIFVLLKDYFDILGTFVVGFPYNLGIENPGRGVQWIHSRIDSDLCKSTAQYCGRIEVRECSRSEEHTSELQSRGHLVCRLLLDKK